jgi:hypothetical protein
MTKDSTSDLLCYLMSIVILPVLPVSVRTDNFIFVVDFSRKS